jgi:hypothetical protein
MIFLVQGCSCYLYSAPTSTTARSFLRSSSAAIRDWIRARFLKSVPDIGTGVGSTTTRWLWRNRTCGITEDNGTRLPEEDNALLQETTRSTLLNKTMLHMLTDSS